MDLISSGHIVKPIAIDPKGRLKQYYDTKRLKQGDSILHFFPAQAQRESARNNYVNNPIPGNEIRKVLSIGIDINYAVIESATNIDPFKIINAIKQSSIKLTLNSDNVQVLEQPISNFLNFSSSGVAMNSDGTKKAVSVSSKGLVRLADPFQVGIQQVFDLNLNVANAGLLPTVAHWEAANLPPLEVTVMLLMSEEVAKS
ncbi:MAG: hypothetical protein LAT67_05120 [Balneolales bacterium]|nr:hypothetical protein [Balneolales bacterium]